MLAVEDLPADLILAAIFQHLEMKKRKEREKKKDVKKTRKKTKQRGTAPAPPMEEQSVEVLSSSFTDPVLPEPQMGKQVGRSAEVVHSCDVDGKPVGEMPSLSRDSDYGKNRGAPRGKEKEKEDDVR